MKEALSGPIGAGRGDPSGARLTVAAGSSHRVPVGPESAAHLPAEAGSAGRIAVCRWHTLESNRAVGVEEAVRACPATLFSLPPERLVSAVQVALASPQRAGRHGSAGARLPCAAGARHLVPSGPDAATHLAAGAGSTCDLARRGHTLESNVAPAVEVAVRAIPAAQLPLLLDRLLSTIQQALEVLARADRALPAQTCLAIAAQAGHLDSLGPEAAADLAADVGRAARREVHRRHALESDVAVAVEVSVSTPSAALLPHLLGTHVGAVQVALLGRVQAGCGRPAGARLAIRAEAPYAVPAGPEGAAHLSTNARRVDHRTGAGPLRHALEANAAVPIEQVTRGAAAAVLPLQLVRPICAIQLAFGSPLRAGGEGRPARACLTRHAGAGDPVASGPVVAAHLTANAVRAQLAPVHPRRAFKSNVAVVGEVVNRARVSTCLPLEPRMTSRAIHEALAEQLPAGHRSSARTRLAVIAGACDHVSVGSKGATNLVADTVSSAAHLRHALEANITVAVELAA
mmetsp:Transcript_12708/g.33733  ORF Transcript_12708/g.33733 Transcript_12708/m.33733 type:complete len:516 (+) Transcript_12708:374-1921(+)